MPREIELARALFLEVRAGTRTRADVIRSLPPTFLAPASLSLDVDPRAQDACRTVPAGPGVASGAIVFRPADAERAGERNEAVLLVVEETYPEDIAAMTAARGIVAVRAGLTGHAAIVARGLGRPCVCGGSAVSFGASPSSDRPVLRVELNGGDVLALEHGTIMSFDGSSGVLTTMPARLLSLGPEVDEILGWATALASGQPIESASPVELPSFSLAGPSPADVIARAKAAIG